MMFWSQMWKEHLHLGGVSAKDEAKADRLAASLNKVRQTNFSPSFKVLDVDHRGARAVSGNGCFNDARQRPRSLGLIACA